MSKWQKVRIEEVVDILDSQRIPITARDRTPGPYPYYGANGIQDYINQYIFDGDFVLVAEDGGNFGSKTRPIAYYVSGKLWVNNHAHILKAKPGLDTKYLCYSLMFYDVTEIITGSTRKKLTQAALRKMKIPYPELKTQKRIASTLDAVSELLRLRKAQLAELDNLVKSQFIEMFGDPVTNPKGWDIRPLSGICENLDSRRVPITGSVREKGPYPYYGASGIVDYVNDYIFDEELLLVSEDGANLLARVTPIAFPVSGKVWVNNHAHVLRFACKDTQIYVEYRINHIDVSNYITGTAQPKLNQAQLNAFPIPMPPTELQACFANFVRQADKSKFAIQQSLDETQRLFDSLMAEYFE